MGFEHTSGRSFDPLVNADPGGEVLDHEKLQKEAIERVKNDNVDIKSSGNDATKPLSAIYRKTGIFSTSKAINFLISI